MFLGVIVCYLFLHLLYSIEVNIAPIKVDISPIEVDMVDVGLVGSASLLCGFLLRWSMLALEGGFFGSFVPHFFLSYRGEPHPLEVVLGLVSG